MYCLNKGHRQHNERKWRYQYNTTDNTLQSNVKQKRKWYSRAQILLLNWVFLHWHTGVCIIFFSTMQLVCLVDNFLVIIIERSFYFAAVGTNRNNIGNASMRASVDEKLIWKLAIFNRFMYLAGWFKRYILIIPLFSYKKIHLV